MIVNLTSPVDYDEKEEEAKRQFAALLAKGERVSLVKNVKHTWKDPKQKPNLDLRQFNRVMRINTDALVATVEGMTSFYDLVKVTLDFGLMPRVVPELREITVGGAIAGLGGQSSSFRFGLIHEMVMDFDLLTGEGKVLHCSPEEHADLFYMLPNSYGSLGYVLKCNIKLNPVSPYVRLKYGRFGDREEFFAAMDEAVRAQEADFVEGVSFSPQQFVLLIGEFVEALRPGETPYVPLSDPFFISQRDSLIEEATMTARDYIWRWDTDAFFATDQQNIFGKILLNPLFRRTLGKYVLRSDRLIQIGKFRNRLRKNGQAKLLFQEGARREALIQDAAIPFERAAEFDAWLADRLDIYPLWYCPVKTLSPIGTYPLYRPGSEFVVDFGFYCSMDLEEGMADYHYNQAIEKKLVRLDGLKCLYSDTFFPEEQFWSIYDKQAYDRVKRKYDPDGTFLDLYSKVVNKKLKTEN
jgi:FAD/FMN-containing dehydrogenase